MDKEDFENLMDRGTADPKSLPPDWLEEYKKRKLERESEETLEISAEDTLEKNVPAKTLPDTGK